MSGGSKNIHGPNKFFFCPCYFAREYMWSKIGAPKSIDPPGDDYSSWDSWASVNEHHPTSRTSFWLKPTHICDLLYHRFLITWLKPCFLVRDAVEIDPMAHFFWYLRGVRVGDRPPHQMPVGCPSGFVGRWVDPWSRGWATGNQRCCGWPPKEGALVSIVSMKCLEN